LDRSQPTPSDNGARTASVSRKLADKVESLRTAILNHRKLQARSSDVDEVEGGLELNASTSMMDVRSDANEQTVEENERIEDIGDTLLENHQEHAEWCGDDGEDTKWSEQAKRIESLENAALQSRKRTRDNEEVNSQAEDNVADLFPNATEETEAETPRNSTKRPMLKASEKTENLKKALLQNRRRKVHMDDEVHPGDNDPSVQQVIADPTSEENVKLNREVAESGCPNRSETCGHEGSGPENLKCEALFPELQDQTHPLNNVESMEFLDKPLLQWTTDTETNPPCDLTSTESPNNPLPPWPLTHLSTKQQLDSCSHALVVIIERINKAAAVVDYRQELVVFNRTLQQVNRLRQSTNDDIVPSSKDDKLLLKNLPIVLEFLSTLLKYENNLNKRLLVPVIKLLRSCRAPDAREASTYTIPASSPTKAELGGPAVCSTIAGSKFQTMNNNGSASPSAQVKRNMHAFYPESAEVPAALEVAKNLYNTPSHNEIAMLRNDVHRIQTEIDDCISKTLDLSSYIHLLDIEKMKALDLQEEEENRIATLRMQLTLAIRMIHAQSSLARAAQAPAPAPAPAPAVASNSDKPDQDGGSKN